MIELNEKNFKREVLKEKNLPVLVDFYANWCEPCRMQTPILSSFAKNNADKIKVYKINIDNALGIANDYSVTSIPTLLLFNNGLVTKKVVGLQDEKNLFQLLQ